MKGIVGAKVFKCNKILYMWLYTEQAFYLDCMDMQLIKGYMS